MKKGLLIAGGILAVGAAVGGFLLWRARSKVDPTVTQPYVEKDLTTDEIRAKLASPEFKDRLEAGKQIEKLDPEEKLRVLLKLAGAPEASARLLAAKNLKKIDDPRAKRKLAELANDPDADVAEVAK